MSPAPVPKHIRSSQLSFRITPVDMQILYALQDHYGVSQAAVFAMLLRDRARDLGWDVTKPPRALGSTLGTGQGGRHG